VNIGKSLAVRHLFSEQPNMKHSLGHKIHSACLPEHGEKPGDAPRQIFRAP
jgi:hypothetical protein